MDLNQVNLVGRLAGKVVYSPGAGDKASRAVGRLMVNRPPSSSTDARAADAIQVVAWGVHADNLAKYTDTGKELAIVGQIRTNSVKKGNVWTNYFEVKVDSMSFGHDSEKGKVIKALQGTGETLDDAQRMLDEGVSAAQVAADAISADPKLTALLRSIVAGNVNTDVDADKETAEEKPSSVENPFGQ